eukprot:9468941-Pyramimonas_sp.AAC.1
MVLTLPVAEEAIDVDALAEHHGEVQAEEPVGRAMVRGRLVLRDPFVKAHVHGEVVHAGVHRPVLQVLSERHTQMLREIHL